MNALAMQQISNEAKSTGSRMIQQVGANKFFYSRGWTSLGDLRTSDQNVAKRDLIAYGGYFLSFRPGQNNELLLNVNTATSTFFPPTLISQFVANLRNAKDRDGS
jgi:hypothetical protein